MSNNSEIQSKYPVLQEFSPHKLISMIPAQAQKGLNTININFTCVDVTKEYIALGSSIGIIYLYDRKKETLQRLRNEDYTDAITCVKMVISLECMVAAGSRKGNVVAFKVPFDSKQEMEKFAMQGSHSSPITALEWAKNGIKLFSGDSSGVVVCSEINHLEHCSVSRIILVEEHEIVQLSYSIMLLLVSTMHKSVLYNFKDGCLAQVGQKERKSLGRFGATFFSQDSDIIFASRPGLRIWKSKHDGVITETIILKDIFNNPHSSISLLKPVDISEDKLRTFQFGLLRNYSNKYLISWSDCVLVLIDPNLRTVVACCKGLDSILDVATTEDEIFVIQSSRHLLRIATQPEITKDNKISDGSRAFADFITPLKDFGLFLSDKTIAPEIKTNTESSAPLAKLSWLKSKLSGNKPAPDNKVSVDKIIETTFSDNLPAVVKLEFDDYPALELEKDLSESASYRTNLQAAVKDKKTTFCKTEGDDIVFRPRKKKKEKIKEGSATSDLESSIETTQPSNVFHHDTKSAEASQNMNSVYDEKQLENENVNHAINNSGEASQDMGTNVDEIQLNNLKPESPSRRSISNPFNNDNKSYSYLQEDNKTKELRESIFEDHDKILKNILSMYSQLKQGGKSEEISKTNSLHSEPQQSEEAEDLQSSSVELSEVDASIPDHEINYTENESGLKVNTNASKSTSDGNEIQSPEDIYPRMRFDSNKSETYLDELNDLLISDSLESEIVQKDEEGNLSLSESFHSFDSTGNEIPKYGVDWLQFKAPGSLVSLSITDDQLFCVDSKDILYFSKFSSLGLSWQQINQPANQVSVSSSGDILWALYRGTVYAALQNDQKQRVATEWREAAANVVYIAVDDSCAWYISCTGQLVTQQNLTLVRPYAEPSVVPCPWTISQVACRNGVVWVLTTGSRVYYRVGITSQFYAGSNWKEMKLGPISSISGIALGAKNIGWVVDNQGTMWFRIGVSRSMPDGSDNVWWQVEDSGYLYQSLNQVKKAMMKVVNTEMLTSLIYGPQQVCIVAGETGVWYCKTLNNLLYSNQKVVIGHSWDLVTPHGTSLSTKWNCISAGVCDTQGMVWCTNSIGELFCFSPVSNARIVVELPTSVLIKSFEATPESLWLLSTEGAIYIRREITRDCPQGVWWLRLNLQQLSGSQLSHISCAPDVVWACDTEGRVHVRIGTLNPPSGTHLSQAWIMVDSNIPSPAVVVHKLSAIGKQFPLPLLHPVSNETIIKKVYVGPRSYMVWALDDSGNVYVRDGITVELPVGVNWVFVPGFHAKELCISHYAVWALKCSGKIYRRFGITENNLTGDYWKLIPGNVSSLSVTEDDDLWGLHDGTICRHFSFALQHQSVPENPPCEENVDDWEIV